MMIEKEIKNGKLIIVETKNLTAKWGKKEFCVYSDEFKRGRSSSIDSMSRCYCCNWPFQLNTEMIALVCFPAVGNKVVCGDCFDELEFSDGKN